MFDGDLIKPSAHVGIAEEHRFSRQKVVVISGYGR